MDHLRQLCSICHGQMTQLDQKHSLLLIYSLVHTEAFRTKLSQTLFICLKRHPELLPKDQRKYYELLKLAE